LKDSIRPMPGLPVNIDGMYGIIRTVAGGRVIVDFNHPLSGKEIVYNSKLKNCFG
ncbi:peptidylprolyl isomerase FKBP-type, partial [sediment metagenome]